MSDMLLPYYDHELTAIHRLGRNLDPVEPVPSVVDARQCDG